MQRGFFFIVVTELIFEWVLEFVDINISRERGLGLNISYGCRWRNNPTVQ